MEINSYRQFKSEGSHYFGNYLLLLIIFFLFTSSKLLVSLPPPHVKHFTDCNGNLIIKLPISSCARVDSILKQNDDGLHAIVGIQPISIHHPFRVGHLTLDFLPFIKWHFDAFLFEFINGNRHFNDTRLL
jgi:hypothetical protein